MSKLFKNLKAGLEEAIAHEQGKINLRSVCIEIPDAPSNYKPKQIKNNNYSQGVLQKYLT